METKIQGEMVEGRGKNTRFFHKIANAHTRNSMLRIKINGRWFNEENGLTENAVEAFQNLLSENGIGFVVVRVLTSMRKVVRKQKVRGPIF